MPLSAIDPSCALLVVDLQKGVSTRHNVKHVLGNAAALAAAFRRHHLPVVLITVDGRAPGRTDARRNTTGSQTPRPAHWAEPAPELDPQPDDIHIRKERWGAFASTDLHQRLQERGVTQTVISGVATSIGVESTARAAHEHGYHVVLATDAMADLDTKAHRHSLKRIFPRLGETATTTDILTALRTHRRN
jgi:nicotinamidase-related amidase